MLYYFNLFNILYFDCTALPLRLQFTASVNCGGEIRLPEKKNHKLLNIKAVNAIKLSYFIVILC